MNKILIFCMGIIIAIISSSQCFMMNIWNSDQVEWDSDAFTQKLEAQKYSWLMDRLCTLLKDSSINAEVLGWIEEGAEAGHVPMMYLVLRNYALALQHNIVIRDDKMWVKIGKYLLLSFVRLYQDEMYCTGSGNVRPREANAASWFNPVAYFEDKWDRNIFNVFKKKYDYWFGKQNLAKKIPFSDALASVNEWLQAHNVDALDPRWAKYAYPSPGSPTLKIIFENPKKRSRVLTIADQSAVRTELCQNAYHELEGLNNWVAFFAQQENFEFEKPRGLASSIGSRASDKARQVQAETPENNGETDPEDIPSEDGQQ